MLLSGQVAATHYLSILKEKIASFPSPPGLGVILIGTHAPSHAYVTMKQKACHEVGIIPHLYSFPENCKSEDVLKQIHSLNEDPTIHGILLQLPIPGHLPMRALLEAIVPSKDVDGLHPYNMGKLLLGITDGFIPCTPLGIQKLLNYYQISPQGKHAVIVGRSNIVGKPMASLLMQNHEQANATVTLTHSQTPNISTFTQAADLLIVALGSPFFISKDMVKEGAIVIDVGINRIEDPHHPKGYRLVGDVDFASVEKKCAAITPVPKGVGPMTVAMLLHNTCQGYERSLA